MTNYEKGYFAKYTPTSSYKHHKFSEQPVNKSGTLIPLEAYHIQRLVA